MTTDALTTRRFRIQELLGQGGFGKVYRARYLQGPLELDVALKVLHTVGEEQQQALHRLMDEARYLSLLNHEAIVKVLGVVQIQGEWAVLMEYVEGRDLEAALKHLGPVPPRAALEITGEIAGALAYAFAREGPSGETIKLVHRDIKLSNIQLTNSAKVKLLDFGIARAEIVRSTQTQSAVPLTPEYAPPERLRWLFDADSAEPTYEALHVGDVYSLGLVLAMLLTGARHPARRPLREPEREAWAAALRAELEARGPLPEGLLALIFDMLAIEPDARPTAEEVERRCAALAERCGGDRLRDWARGALAALPKPAPRKATDPWVGQVLVEGPASARPTAPGWGARRWLLVAAALVTLGGGLLAGRAFRRAAGPAEEVPAAPPASAPATVEPVAGGTPEDEKVEAEKNAAAPVEEEPAEGRVTQPAPPAKATTGGGPSAPSTRRADPAPAAPAEPSPAAPAQAIAAAPSAAKVSQRGAETVILTGEGGVYTLPALVPPGPYRVSVSFRERPGLMDTYPVSIEGDRELVCTAANASCR